MASCATILLLVCFCVSAGNVQSFVDLVCDDQTVGQLGHQSMLNCVIKPRQGITDVNIETVVWKKMMAPENSVLFFDTDKPFNPKSSYVFAEPSWKKDNMNVSLLITSTELADEGEYICEVITDSGIDGKKTSLKVTAKYNAPQINLINERDIPNANKALICRAQGGYPAGHLRWFDGTKTEWTKSAELEAKKMDNGLFELSSKLPLLPGSTFPEYTCVVYNSSGGEEHEVVFLNLEMRERKEDPQTDSSTSRIVAPVVVIGSLIVGLLIALLIYRRRSNQIRRPSATPFLDPSQQCPADEMDYVAPQKFPSVV